jgi:heme exporter protein D
MIQFQEYFTMGANAFIVFLGFALCAVGALCALLIVCAAIGAVVNYIRRN